MPPRSIALIALLTLGLGACAEAPTTGGAPSSPAIGHDGGPGDLLLRWGYEGGFTPPEYQLTNLPTFSLYGDGTVVRPGPQLELYPGPALPALETVRLDEAGIQLVLEAALDAELDMLPDLTDMGSVGIADAPETVFTVRFGGVDRTVRVYALTEMGDRIPGLADEESEARKGLLDLIDRLGSLDSWLPVDSVSDVAAFEPAGVRAIVSDSPGRPDIPQPKVAWPLPTPLQAIGQAAGGDIRCVAVTGSDWTDVLRPVAQTANELTPWTSEGHRYSVAFRPLLPDETTC